ncbi:ATPase [Aureococcus anophagefferens]|nr:ATPase [Aureococcus anophagefferens]
MGPSGSGKTTLISLLTLRAPRGRATGRVTLGGLALTQRRFRRLCFVVNQDDELWPTLTPREQLRHATQLFAAAGADIEPGRAEEIIDRLGLASCADTFVGHALVPGGLSGGQKRRLSIGVALVKQPVAAFLDEPTSGLDAAASLHTMAFVRSLAKDEHLIVVATIHQPSTKVFLDFDTLLLLSEGRVAYSGAASSAAAAFEGLGHVLPPLTNPADFLLDVVNSDFSDAGVVREILDAYAAARERRRATVDDDAHFHSGGVDAGLETAVVIEPTMRNQVVPLLRRHATLLARDLVLVGVRATCFFFGNLYFATVYVKSRERHQTQVANRVWLLIWMNAVPACLTLVIVVAINMETRMVKSRSSRASASSRSASPGFAVANFTAKDGAFFTTCAIWCAGQFCWDCYGTACAVAFDHPLLGTALYMFAWFSSFLYAGFIIPIEDVKWPLRALAYVFPMGRSIRSMIWSDFIRARYDACDNYSSSHYCYCGDDWDPAAGCDGKHVLRDIGIIYRSISARDKIAEDVAYCAGLGFLAGAYACVAFYRSTRGSAAPRPPSAARSGAPMVAAKHALNRSRPPERAAAVGRRRASRMVAA